jgi:hypothetical protein
MIRLNKVASRPTAAKQNAADNISGAHASTSTYNDIIDKAYDDIYNVDDSANNKDNSKVTYNAICKSMHKSISTDYKKFSPHVGGYYYIHMVGGTWLDDLSSATGDKDNDTTGIKDYTEFSEFEKDVVNSMKSKKYGKHATDIDPPQLSIEYESISGKVRNINYASRINLTNDFSINYVDNMQLDVFRYHDYWVKYIEALKKGYIKSSSSNDTSMFIDIPYFNAVWIVLFNPMKTGIRGLIKILGVSPIGLPIKQIIGNRSKSEMTTISQNYKCIDMVTEFYENEEDLLSSAFYKEYVNDYNT